jgi:hypothetical protein
MKEQAARIIALASLVFSSLVQADLTIRYDAVKGQQRQAFQALMLKGPLLRVDPASPVPPSVLVDVASGDIVQLHEPSGRYFRVNAETIDTYVNLYRNNRTMLQGLIDQGLSRFPPGQKSDIQEVIRQFDRHQATSQALEIRRTDKVDEVLGANCQVLSVVDRGRITSQVCIAEYAELGLDTDDVRDLERLKLFALKFRDTAPGRHRELFSLLAGPEKLNGIPLKVIRYRDNGEVSQVIVARSISFRPIPPQAYRIPAHFRERSTPIL